MGAEIERADPSAPHEVEPDRDDIPTRFAHVRIETSEVKAEMAVPSSQTRRLLTTVLDVLIVLGAVLGPTLTLKAAAAALPTWATAGTIAGQLALLAVVGVIAHRPEHPGRLPS